MNTRIAEKEKPGGAGLFLHGIVDDDHTVQSAMKSVTAADSSFFWSPQSALMALH